MSAICLCLRGTDRDSLLSCIRSYESRVDLFELRLDFLPHDQHALMANLPRETETPIILCARRQRDGGQWPRSEEEKRQNLLVDLLESGGWAYVDVEHCDIPVRIVDVARSSGTGIICSIHDFSGDFTRKPVVELKDIVQRIAEDNDVVKLALQCNGSRDFLFLVRASVALENVQNKIILGMGEFAVPSRILAATLGSVWSYSFARDEGEAVAAGQIDVDTLRDTYRFHAVNSSTPLYGLVGNPVSRSRSPLIHNGWLSDMGLQGCYVPILSDNLNATLEACDLMGFKGLSITIPWKEQAISSCENIGTQAKVIGSVNTLERRGDGWNGRNTDGEGFMCSLLQALKAEKSDVLRGCRVLVIGAGGAARSAVYMLCRAGADVLVLNRREERARKLADEFGVKWGALNESSAFLVHNIDIAVQTTSLGMRPNEKVDPLPWWQPSGCRLAYDMIYEPEETVFLARCRSLGVPVANGMGMLVEQAKRQFRIFTGKYPD